MSEATIYNALRKGGLSEAGACAMMGNMFKESSLRSNNAEDSKGISDEEYTKAIDEGRISGYEFQKDRIGYGLCQWSFPSRKRELYNLALGKQVSIADEAMQCEFCITELKRDFSALYDYLCVASNLYAATEKVCWDFERPDKEVADIPKRTAAALRYYNQRKKYEEGGENVKAQIQSSTEWLKNLAEDDSHGYEWGGWGPKDYDCGHAIIAAWEQAGVPVKTNGATYTENMYPAFIKSGFADVTSKVNLNTGYGLEYGDVLLNKEKHAAQYIGNGQMVHARSNDGHPETGDQTGREICIQQYRNYPWNYVLRYVGCGNTESTIPSNPVENTFTPQKNNRYYPSIMKKGDVGPEVKELQKELNEIGFSCGEPDGDYGKLTVAGVTEFQKAYNLKPIDGEAGPITLAALVRQYKEKTGKTSAFAEETKEKTEPFKLGEIVNYTGDKQYLGANFFISTRAKPGTAIITAIMEGAKHPYHLSSNVETSASVYGWVDSDTVQKR